MREWGGNGGGRDWRCGNGRGRTLEMREGGREETGDVGMGREGGDWR